VLLLAVCCQVSRHRPSPQLSTLLRFVAYIDTASHVHLATVVHYQPHTSVTFVSLPLLLLLLLPLYCSFTIASSVAFYVSLSLLVLSTPLLFSSSLSVFLLPFPYLSTKVSHPALAYQLWTVPLLALRLVVASSTAAIVRTVPAASCQCCCRRPERRRVWPCQLLTASSTCDCAVCVVRCPAGMLTSTL